MSALYYLDLAGMAVFAVTGALAAGRKRMDGFGVVVLALVTATGGGTLRDLILDLPVFWTGDQGYLLVAVAAALATMATARWWIDWEPVLGVVDALGLGLFVAVGTAKAAAAGVPVSVALAMGVLTGCGGGILRDTLAGDMPFVFRGELYATAALAGSGLFSILAAAGAPVGLSLWASAGLTTAVRLAAMRWHLRLPVFNLPRD